MPIYDALTMHGPLQSGTSRLITERFIIVAPQLPVAGDNWHTKSAAIRQLVTTVQTEFRGNPNRTYLTGFSFGGNGVFDIAIAQPDLWAALWAVDPTRPPGGHLQHPLWLSLGELSRPKRTAFIELMKDAREARSQTPVSENNFVFEDSGEDHVGTARVAYGSQRIYDWLFTKTRPNST
jgi:predicted peptidase